MHSSYLACMKLSSTNTYAIRGGTRLQGTIRVKGNKNSALPCITACLLTKEPVILRDIPEIQDVRVLLEIVSELGAKVQRKKHGCYEIHSANIDSAQIPEELGRSVRASVLFAGPLLARLGEVVLPPPGGDVIGRRRLDTHFHALKELGARLKMNDNFSLVVKRLKGASIFMDEASVTATENAIMAAVLAKGETVISNAASEPHVQDLCRMLISMGASINGVGSNILYIEGVESLHGTEFTIGPDHMETGSFIGLAAVTGSELTIDNICEDHLRMMKITFGRLGIRWETDGNTLHISGDQKLEVVPDIGGAIPKIDDAPWPGFPADLTSIMTVVATQVKGTVLIHEKLFESRMFFVDKLIEMGAGIILCDPHRAVVSGPSRLRGSYLVSPDVRAGMAMVIAALCAEGASTIDNVYQIERGYENLVDRLKELGADMRRVRGGVPE